MHFIRQIVSRLVYDGRGSLCWCHTRPQPAAHWRCSKAVATGCTTSARKAHLRMTLEDGIRRGVEPRLLVLMVRLLVLWNFGPLARWVPGSTPPLTPTALSLVAQSSPNPLSDQEGKERTFLRVVLLEIVSKSRNRRKHH